MRGTVGKGINRGIFPASERTSPSRYVDGDRVPGVALRQIGFPALRGFPLVDHSDDKPRHAGPVGDGNVSGFCVRIDQPAGCLVDHGHKAGNNAHVLPTMGIGIFQQSDVNHFVLAALGWRAVDPCCHEQTLRTMAALTIFE